MNRLRLLPLVFLLAALAPATLNGQDGTPCEMCYYVSTSTPTTTCTTTYDHIYGLYFGYERCNYGNGPVTVSEWVMPLRPQCVTSWGTCPDPNLRFAE